MLKIKDNIDLKELEKYGIQKGYYTKSDNNKEEVLSIDENRIITVSKRLWWSMQHYYGIVEKNGAKDGEEILYDLILNGLVEKVER